MGIPTGWLSTEQVDVLLVVASDGFNVVVEFDRDRLFADEWRTGGIRGLAGGADWRRIFLGGEGGLGVDSGEDGGGCIVGVEAGVAVNVGGGVGMVSVEGVGSDVGCVGAEGLAIFLGLVGAGVLRSQVRVTVTL